MDKRRVAKALFWVAGWLSRIRMPQRSYELVSTDPVTFGPAKWSWSSWGFAFRVLNWSMQLDWDHWDHWACDHSQATCCIETCTECGGTLCPAEEARLAAGDDD